jgi:phosphate:Na+ symporter
MNDLALSIITLFVGAAVFIVGMNMMSSGLKKSTGPSLKKLLKKIRNNRFACFGIGTTVTMLVQSSAATGVMAIGFIAAGTMTVFQGVNIILGAYVGTTITGLLAALSSVKIAKYFVVIAAIGVILMFFKKEHVKNIGEILAGLGLLFFGLNTMSGVLSEDTGNPQLVKMVQDFFSAVSFPLLLVLIGAVVTILVQSSSASVSIVVSLTGSVIGFEQAMFLVLGATIGTVFTLLLATIGGNVNVKRTGIIVLIIRILTALVALAICWPLGSYISTGFQTVFDFSKEGGPELAIAVFHILYNVIFMLAALPLVKPLEKLSFKLVKDKEQEKMKQSLKYIDNHLLDTPTVAMMQVKREIINMMHLSYDNLRLGYQRILTQDNSQDKELIETEDKIDYINNAITQFLINLTHNVSLKDEKTLGSYFHVVNDIERIGDHAYNFYESSLKMVSNDLKFSDVAKKEFDSMFDVICQMFDLTFVIFHDKSRDSLKKLHDLEDQTDNLKNTLSTAHYERIQNKTCHVENSPFYTTLVSELERVADHLVNIGYSIVNPTGDDPTEKLTEQYE